MEPQCPLAMPCKWFNYVAGLGAFTVDVLTFIGLWYTITPKWLRDFLPEFWYAPLIIFGYAIITQITIDSKVYRDNDDVLAKPPEYMWPHKWRIALYAIIMIMDIIMFSQMYIDSGINDYSKNFKVFDYLVSSRFGGWGKGNYVQFMFSWLALCGIMVDIFALYYTVTFNTCRYKLPRSWSF